MGAAPRAGVRRHQLRRRLLSLIVFSCLFMNGEAMRRAVCRIGQKAGANNSTKSRLTAVRTAFLFGIRKGKKFNARKLAISVNYLESTNNQVTLSFQGTGQYVSAHRLKAPRERHPMAALFKSRSKPVALKTTRNRRLSSPIILRVCS
jgi:hypothetical protein